MCRYLLLLLSALVCVSESAPRQRQKPIANSWVKPLPNSQPQGSELLLDAQVGHVLRHAPGGARLLAVQPAITALIDRLPDNATLIRPNLVEGFTCDNKGYGYYADDLNECQIFHVCVPLQELYPANFTEPVTFTFSFICPEYTVFSQDALTCAWTKEALPCEYAKDLYWINKNFGRVVIEDDGNTRYAYLNEKLAGQDVAIP